MRIFALDPGPVLTGWCILEDGRVVDSGVHPNCDLLDWVKHGQHADLMAIEMIANMGMAVGQATFDTVRWIGRFQQAWIEPDAVRLVFRREVKQHLCGNQQAKDPNIRQALIDKLGAPGKKAAPGPTYGVTSHAWSALAVAVTAAETAPIVRQATTTQATTRKAPKQAIPCAADPSECPTNILFDAEVPF